MIFNDYVKKKYYDLIILFYYINVCIFLCQKLKKLNILRLDIPAIRVIIVFLYDRLEYKIKKSQKVFAI